MTRRHFEQHFTKRTGWLRAAVLGANDGIISTASLIIGIAAANASHNSILLTGFAGLVAGAMSMAAGEYVSVSSQADIERADLNREKQELENTPEHEHQELTNIYIQRGLDITLAAQVATQLMDRDALGSHAHDELGMSETRAAPGASGIGFGSYVRPRGGVAVSHCCGDSFEGGPVRSGYWIIDTALAVGLLVCLRWRG